MGLAVYGTSSPAWKRGPLAPVVVVGEGQVNLVSGRCKAVPWAKSPKLCGTIDFDDEPNPSPPVATVTVVVSGLA